MSPNRAVPRCISPLRLRRRLAAAVAIALCAVAPVGDAAPETGDEFGQHGAAPLPGARFGGVDTRPCNFDRTALPRGKPRSITERQTGALGSQRGSVNGQREQSAGQRQT